MQGSKRLGEPGTVGALANHAMQLERIMRDDRDEWNVKRKDFSEIFTSEQFYWAGNIEQERRHCRKFEMDDRNNAANGLWIFGYGSLCWHPGFEYNRSTTGYVKGFSRKFWQGNTTHRGTAEKPGRVATLVEEAEGTVYGRAFQVQNNAALPYLENRECALGGYVTTVSTFYSREENRNFPVIIYIATNKNEHWLGDAPLHSIAQQIFECSGPSGHNVEYLLRLAEFMHRYLPEAHDEHLFALELLVRSKIEECNLCLRTLMGNREFRIDLDSREHDVREEHRVGDGKNDPAINLRENSFPFLSQVPAKTLRCLKT